MKRSLKKLTLNRETIVRLGDERLTGVAGGNTNSCNTCGTLCFVCTTSCNTCGTLCFVCPSNSGCDSREC